MIWMSLELSSFVAAPFVTGCFPFSLAAMFGDATDKL